MEGPLSLEEGRGGGAKFSAVFRQGKRKCGKFHTLLQSSHPGRPEGHPFTLLVSPGRVEGISRSQAAPLCPLGQPRPEPFRIIDPSLLSHFVSPGRDGDGSEIRTRDVRGPASKASPIIENPGLLSVPSSKEVGPAQDRPLQEFPGGSDFFRGVRLGEGQGGPVDGSAADGPLHTGPF